MKIRKVTLDLDALAVQSFATSTAAKDQRGTVQGHATDYGGESCAWQCGTGGYTEQASCIRQCNDSMGPEACTAE